MRNPYESADPAIYRRVRPGYPQEAVSAVLDGSPAVVADVGAGTGIFSWQLLGADPNVFVEAVEPSSAMLADLRGHPRLRVHVATSESTGLPDRSVDRLVWAQSFHWVDRQRTAIEAARLLRPGGRAFVLANQMDVSEAWVHRLTRIMRSGDIIKESWNPQLTGFRTGGPRVFRWVQVLSDEELLALARTRSSYLRSDTRARDRMQQNLRWYLGEHLGSNSFEIPYLTYMWTLDNG